MQSYFSGRGRSVLEIICIAGLILCIPVAIFLPGGIPIGGTVAAVLAAILIFRNTAKVKDSEVDIALENLLGDRKILLDPRTTIGTFDLSVTPIIKGKDGKLRTSLYVVSQFAEDAKGLHITVYRVNLLGGTVERHFHDLPPNTPLSLTQTPVQTPVGQRIRSALTSPLIDEEIPVTMEDVNSARLVEWLGTGRK